MANYCKLLKCGVIKKNKKYEKDEINIEYFKNNGKIEGEHKTYVNNVLFRVINFINGKKNGITIYYDPYSGKLYANEFYENNRIVERNIFAPDKDIKYIFDYDDKNCAHIRKFYNSVYTYHSYSDEKYDIFIDRDFLSLPCLKNIRRFYDVK